MAEGVPWLYGLLKTQSTKSSTEMFLTIFWIIMCPSTNFLARTLVNSFKFKISHFGYLWRLMVVLNYFMLCFFIVIYFNTCLVLGCFNVNYLSYVYIKQAYQITELNYIKTNSTWHFLKFFRFAKNSIFYFYVCWPVIGCLLFLIISFMQVWRNNIWIIENSLFCISGLYIEYTYSKNFLTR